MSIEKEWIETEEKLRREAGSLAELLELLRTHVSPSLIGDREWNRLLERVAGLPANMAAFPFGFELPLNERLPRADFGVSVIGGTGPAVFFEKSGQSDDADASTAGIARLLQETDQQESPLRHIVGRKMMLEYDIDTSPRGLRPEPGIFLRPAERPIVGDGTDQRIRDTGVVLDKLVSAAGWLPDAAERRQVERVHRAQQVDTRIESFGAFPSRERAIRMAVTGFRETADVMEFLDRAGWPGQHQSVAGAVSRFRERGGFIELGVHLDVHSGSLGSRLGLSYLARERTAKDPRYWLDGPQLWTTFLDGLGEEGLVVPEKLAALANWQQGPAMLFGRSGTFILLRGIHHIKLALTEARIEQVKAYVFMLLLGAPQS